MAIDKFIDELGREMGTLEGYLAEMAAANGGGAKGGNGGAKGGGSGGGGSGFSLSVSRQNPRFCTPRDTPRTWEWRVERLPYALPTYSVSVDAGRDELVLRTSNKKFFKRWPVHH